MTRLSQTSFFLLTVSAAIAGCSRGDGNIPVAGKVFLSDVPLAGGPRCYVVFQPDRSKGNSSPHEPKSTIGPDGSYQLTTANKSGAPAGWYRVRVDAAEVIDPENPYVTKWLVPEKYVDFQKSGLVVEVVENASPGAYDLKLR